MTTKRTTKTTKTNANETRADMALATEGGNINHGLCLILEDCIANNASAADFRAAALAYDEKLIAKKLPRLDKAGQPTGLGAYRSIFHKREKAQSDTAKIKGLIKAAGLTPEELAELLKKRG